MTAIVSPCGQYRYRLERKLSPLFGHGAVLLLMLNPSTADASADDPTIRRCKGFAQAWGFERLLVGNLYAYRATNPKDLWRVPDPVGPDNDSHLRAMASEADKIVCAWGRNAKDERIEQVLRLLSDRQLYCIALTGEGKPAHPLYLPGVLHPVSWIPRLR